jgi:hypothetical protein
MSSTARALDPANCLLFDYAAAMLFQSWQLPFTGELLMGDKSPKSKQREQKQKQAAKQVVAGHAKAKQDQQSQAAIPAKGKK